MVLPFAIPLYYLWSQDDVWIVVLNIQSLDSFFLVIHRLQMLILIYLKLIMSIALLPFMQNL